MKGFYFNCHSESSRKANKENRGQKGFPLSPHLLHLSMPSFSPWKYSGYESLLASIKYKLEQSGKGELMETGRQEERNDFGDSHEERKDEMRVSP